MILASASPRRSEILRGLGLSFEIEPANVDESRLGDEDPRVYVERVASSKAQNGARAGTVTIAADTTVLIEGSILGKPENPEEAGRMLARLAGRRHEVLTGVAVVSGDRGDSGTLVTSVESSRVKIAEMSPREIDWYVATGEPLDKAGAYAIQGLGSLFVESIQGNYSNIVGLPVPTLRRLVSELGYSLMDFRATAS